MAALALTVATIDGNDQPPVGGVADRALREAQQLPQAGLCATGWATAAGFGRRRRPPAGVGVLSSGAPTQRDGWTVRPGCTAKASADGEARGDRRPGVVPSVDGEATGHRRLGVVLLADGEAQGDRWLGVVRGVGA